MPKVIKKTLRQTRGKKAIATPAVVKPTKATAIVETAEAAERENDAAHLSDDPGKEAVADASDKPTPPWESPSTLLTPQAVAENSMPSATPSVDEPRRDEDVTMSDWTQDDDDEDVSDNESEMDIGDEKEAVMLADAAELYLGNAENQPVMPMGEFTNQELLESMYNRRDRLVQRMVSAMRFHATAKEEVQEANIKAYDEAQKMLEKLEANITRCENVFKMLANPGQRLSLGSDTVPPKEVASPTREITAPVNGVAAANVQDPRQFLDQLKHM
ncbi:hypothetical protein EC968_009201, partial [Mortierella alpina]